MASSRLIAGAVLMLLVGGLWAESRPNILMIMVDDMGYSDIGCYGGEIATPNLDRLAAGGLRFTNFHNNAKCETTRSSLMSGCYPGQIEGAGPIANTLQDAGYETMISGKVHGHGTNGFDHTTTMDSAASHWTCAKPGGESQLQVDGVAVPDVRASYPDWYSTDFWTDQLLGYLQASESGGKPFFAYLAFNAPHYPLHAREDDVMRYRGRYLVGWDVIRERRLRRLRDLGIIDAGTQAAVREDVVPAWETVPERIRDQYDLTMATYAAMIDRVDQNIGRVLRYLEDCGKLDNTVVIFCSDNGAHHGYAGTGDNYRSPLDRDSYESQGREWANLSNTPFRKWKRWKHEGGIASPLIVYWPSGIANPGTFDHDMAWVGDLPVTWAHLAGIEPGDLDPDIQGNSLLPGLQGGTREVHQDLYWTMHDGDAMWQNGWKLVRGRDDGFDDWASNDAAWRLYDLSSDRCELQNLSGSQTSRRQNMIDAWHAWRLTIK